MSDYVLVLISATLINHLCLQQQPIAWLRVHVLGLACALSVALAMIGAHLFRWLVLDPWQLHDLSLFLLLPWLALLAYGVPWALARLRADWPVADLPAVLLSNVAVLGLALEEAGAGTAWLATLSKGLLAGVGLWLALALFADLRQRSTHADIPVALRGLPIELLGVGIMALAFSGFNGLFAQ